MIVLSLCLGKFRCWSVHFNWKCAYQYHAASFSAYVVMLLLIFSYFLEQISWTHLLLYYRFPQYWNCHGYPLWSCCTKHKKGSVTFHLGGEFSVTSGLLDNILQYSIPSFIQSWKMWILFSGHFEFVLSMIQLEHRRGCVLICWTNFLLKLFLLN